MKLDTPLIPLCDYPVGDMLRVLPPAEAAIWDTDQLRQTSYQVHRQTRSILFEWLDKDWSPGGPVRVQRLDYAPAELCAPVYACAARLAEHYPGGRLVRMTLVELKPQGKIAVHVDNGVGVTAVHRVHVPLETNPDVHFFIDRVSHYLEAGTIYEFDNTRPHAVDNRSDRRRVHLLCDVMPASLVA